MKTKKRYVAEVGNLPGFRKTAEETAREELREKEEDTSSSEYRPGSKIQITLKEDGTIDLESMRASTRERLEKALSNTSGFSSVASPGAKGEDLSFGEDEANTLLDLMSAINAPAASAIYKIPSEITTKAFIFTPYHREKINPPLARVINKWAPSALKMWKDEIGLGIILVSTVNAQIRLMHILDEQRKRSIATLRSPAPVTPIKEPSVAEKTTSAEVVGVWPENAPVEKTN